MCTNIDRHFKVVAVGRLSFKSSRRKVFWSFFKKKTLKINKNANSLKRKIFIN